MVKEKKKKNCTESLLVDLDEEPKCLEVGGYLEYLAP